MLIQVNRPQFRLANRVYSPSMDAFCSEFTTVVKVCVCACACVCGRMLEN